MFVLCLVHVCCMFVVCLLHIRCTFGVCLLYICSTFAVLLPYVCCTFGGCFLAVYLFVACLLYGMLCLAGSGLFSAYIRCWLKLLRICSGMARETTDSLLVASCYGN